jgi:hypothetical protein
MRTGRATVALTAAFTVAVAVGLTACADPEDQDLCTIYARFEEAAASLQQVDVDGGRAGEAAEAVDQVLGQVRHLDSVADTRYSVQLERLEDSLEDLASTLASIDEDADAATWEPLVEDSAEEARTGAAVVRDLIAPVCVAQADATPE